MIFISHRGNINGPIPDKENNPLYIASALNLGFDVEVDVHFENGTFFLGHDEPVYATSEKFLKNKHLWCHAKTLNAMLALKEIGANYFYHTDEDYILTSNEKIWTTILAPHSIFVSSELSELPPYWPSMDLAGVCSDYVENLRFQTENFEKMKQDKEALY